MITQWDIISNINAKDNSILYTLLIDGTEHDARLIAKKLQGYAQAPTPALAPYVYSFSLPNDLDEDTLEKIRTAVREGIEQAKKVNEFVPGGSFGNTLFNENVSKEDKAFPTFLTLDPSASFFQPSTSEEIASVNLDVEELDGFQHRQINLDTIRSTDIPTVELAQSAPEITERDFSEEKTKEAPVVLPEIAPSSEPMADPVSAVKEIDLDQPKTEEKPQETDSFSLDDGNAEKLPTEKLSSVVSDPISEPETQPEIQEDLESKETSITNDDMLNADMESSVLEQPLEDIFSAETKYDMFLDLSKLSSEDNQQSTQVKQEEQKKQEELSLQKQTFPAQDASAAEMDTENNPFNIFDQKIKDQTCFVDLEDVKQITERITQKDLGFVEHAHLDSTQPDKAVEIVSEAEKPEEQRHIPLPPKPTLSVPIPFSRFEHQKDKREEVLDPFEQLLASAAQKEEDSQATSNELPQEQPILQDQTPQEPPVQRVFPASDIDGHSTVPQEDKQDVSVQEPLPQPDLSGQTERENRVIPPPAAPIMEKKTMSENTGDKKPILRIKPKVQAPVPPAPAAPLPPAPAAPKAPTAPEAPVAKPVPPVVAPVEAVPPAPVQTAAPAPAPQEEKHHTVLRRRRPSASTILEKTRTIDHSIELPLSELKKHNWPLEVPLIPTYTLENMTISVNRFAHATAISVIDNPGHLYNPLVLHGASGTGKTHFLHAIGYALSKKFGQENIFITNGVRLSRGIQRYIMEGNIAKFEEFTNNAKAILIDDIHLIAVNEQNRAHLSKLLNDFRAQHKQIVVTSKYPPESLAKLEELLNFKLDSGWISELKDAAGKTRSQIIQKMLLSNNINITDEESTRFFGKPNMSLGTVNRAIRRVRVLERLIFPQLAPEQRSSKNIFDQLLATTGEDRSSQVAIRDISEIGNTPVEGNGEWGRIGFFYPQNNSNMMNWMLFALQQRAKELGIPGGPELSVRSSYSTDSIISSAFKIANLCDNKKLKGAVILGPELGICESSVRENFYDILTHMLEIMLIRCGVINYENVNAPSTYVKIISELLR